MATCTEEGTSSANETSGVTTNRSVMVSSISFYHRSLGHWPYNVFVDFVRRTRVESNYCHGQNK